MSANAPDTSSESPLITVLCVDDSSKLVLALCTLIEREKDMTPVGAISDVEEFVRVARELRPRVAIVDLTMPGPVAPIDAIRDMAVAAPEIRVLVYSGYDDPATQSEVMEAGAWGLVSKLAEPSTVISAVRRVAAGEVLF